MKDLKDLSLNITEQEYREDSALSYSLISGYKRIGFRGLSKLKDKIETPSLTFGSMVDSLVTGGIEEFNSRFLVAEFPSISDTFKGIVTNLFNIYGTSCSSLDEISDDIIINVLNEINYQPRWGDATKVNNFRKEESGAVRYYELLVQSMGKSIVDEATAQDAFNCLKALKESASSKFYFQDDDPFDDTIRRYYQLKFKSVIDGVEFKCMVDNLIVDYKNKIIHPVDLKTSSDPEYLFAKHFVEWNYSYQGRLYWRILRDNLDKDEYFKDFKLDDFRFIVVNKETLNPLVWLFEDTTKEGELTYGDIVLEDPVKLGIELKRYLDINPLVPDGINLTEDNSLTKWLNEL